MSEPVQQPEAWALIIQPAAPVGTFNQMRVVFSGFNVVAKFENPRFSFMMTRDEAQKLARNIEPLVKGGQVVGPFPAGGAPEDALKAPEPKSPAAVAAHRWSTVPNPNAPTGVQVGTPGPVATQINQPIPGVAVPQAPPPSMTAPGAPVATPVAKQDIPRPAAFTPGNTPESMKHALETEVQLGQPTPVGPRGTPTAPLPPPIKAPFTGESVAQVSQGSVPVGGAVNIETRLPPGPAQVVFPPGVEPQPEQDPESFEPKATGPHLSHLPSDGPASAIVGAAANYMTDVQAAGNLNMYDYAKMSALKNKRVVDKNHKEWIKLGRMSERPYLVRQVPDLNQHGGKSWLVERKFEPMRELGRTVTWRDAIALVEAEERDIAGPAAVPAVAQQPVAVPAVAQQPVAVQQAETSDQGAPDIALNGWNAALEERDEALRERDEALRERDEAIAKCAALTAKYAALVLATKAPDAVPAPDGADHPVDPTTQGA